MISKSAAHCLRPLRRNGCKHNNDLTDAKQMARSTEDSAEVVKTQSKNKVSYLLIE